MKKLRKLLGISLVLITLFGIAACVGTSNTASSSGRDLTTRIGKNFNASQINYVAIMPFAGLAQLSTDAVDKLNRELLASFEQNSTLQIVNIENREKSQQVIKELADLQKTRKQAAVQLGKRLGAQAVLYGVLSNVDSFEKSVRDMQSARSFGRDDSVAADGASYGGSAAEAGFKLWLVDTKTQKILWSASFYRRQQAVSDNLLQISQALDGGWNNRSSEELFKEGFNKAALSLEKLRVGTAK